jgi:hypothetical protein
MNNTIPIPKNYLERILKPINRLTESCVLKTTEDGLYSVCSSTENTVYLYAKVNFPFKPEKNQRLNLISIKRFLVGLDCLGEENEFSIELNENNLKCSNNLSNGDKTHFKYHLVDDSVIRECPFNVSRISSLNFDTEFTIKTEKLKQIMSGYTFASDSSKIYFYTKDGFVYCEMNDKTIQNIDSITMKVSEEFSGKPLDGEIIISTEVFKNLASSRSDVRVRINNEFKIFIFQNKDDNDVELKYIVPALVK